MAVYVYRQCYIPPPVCSATLNSPPPPLYLHRFLASTYPFFSAKKAWFSVQNHVLLSRNHFLFSFFWLGLRA